MCQTIINIGGGFGGAMKGAVGYGGLPQNMNSSSINKSADAGFGFMKKSSGAAFGSMQQPASDQGISCIFFYQKKIFIVINSSSNIELISMIGYGGAMNGSDAD